MIEPLLEAERAMDMGLLDQAERLYRSVAEADPRNSIAVVGLSRVALERGDEAGALDLARRAVTIDPDNPMAARMVARLVEVRAARGEMAAAARAAEPTVDTTAPAIDTTAPAADTTAPAAGTETLQPPSRPRRSLLGRLFRRP